MFTGIITDLGEIRHIEKRGDWRFVIATHYNTQTIDIGASIACSGPCLTVVEKGEDWFAVDVSAETLSKTTCGQWHLGQAINLERALRIGDELGGHIVSGHVDGLAKLLGKKPEGDSLRLTFEVEGDLAAYVAPKGSVALDGVSLTVNEVNGHQFGVNIIPHTQEKTSLGRLSIGDNVNFEIDTLARYLKRMLDWRQS